MLPSLFVSHGSPMLSVTDSPARRFLQALGQALPRPKAILMVSAHWESATQPAVSSCAEPATIHDFGGFPPALYALHYPAPGAPALAQETANLLAAAGMALTVDPERGLDHGTWVPLSLMYPQAEIPVAQLSLLQHGSPLQHYRIGQALQSLREQGVLVIGSGSMTHNLGEFFGRAHDGAAPDWVTQFDEWMAARLAAGAIDEIMAYRQLAPHAVRNHPTEEHLLPLFVAMGAAGAPMAAERLHQSYEYGVLAMDAYTFGHAARAA